LAAILVHFKSDKTPPLSLPNTFVRGLKNGFACSVVATSPYTLCGSEYSYSVSDVGAYDTWGICVFSHSSIASKSAIQRSLSNTVCCRFILFLAKTFSLGRADYPMMT